MIKQPPTVETLLVAKYVYPVDFAQAERDFGLLQAYRSKLGPVTLIVQSPDRSSHFWHAGGVEVHYLPRFRGIIGLVMFLFQAWRRAEQLIREKSISILEASDLTGAFILIPLRVRARLPLLLHLQFQFFEMSPLATSWWRRWAFRSGARLACRFADSIRCVSEDIKTQAIRAGVPVAKLRVVPARCDGTRFDPARFSARTPGTSFKLIYVGSLTRLKGLDVLLDAVPKVLQKYPEVRVRLVGEGPERGKLERRVREARLSPHVEFIGAVSYSRIPALLGDSDLLVHPALTEAMGRAILEAMAMARPVVATRVGGIPEAIRDGVDGFLVPPGNPDMLAEAVCRVLGSPDLGRNMGVSGRQRVLEHFTLAQGVSALVRWHEEALALRQS